MLQALSERNAEVPGLQADRQGHVLQALGKRTLSEGTFEAPGLQGVRQG